MKKKIFVVALAVCILAFSIASATIAYFTETKTATNTFTSGNVAIKLTETQIVDGVSTTNVVGEGGFTGYDYGAVHPGLTYDKYPAITNTGSENAYLAAKIVIKNVAASNDDANVTKVLTTEAATGKTLVSDFLSGNVFADANYSVKYNTTADSIEIYVIYETVTTTNDSITLFEEVVVPARWGNDQMAHLENMNIVITAYAVQTTGFDSAEAAIEAAFGGGTDATNNDFANYFN